MSWYEHISPGAPLRFVRWKEPELTEKKLEQHYTTAMENGYKEGVAETEEKFAAREREREETLKTLTEKTLGAIQDSYRTSIEAIEKQLPALVLEFTERVLAGYQPSRESVEAIIKDALIGHPDRGGKVTINLSQSDYALIAEGTALEETFPGLNIMADKELGAGDCIVTSDYGTIDARLETKLDKLRTQLIEHGPESDTDA